MGKSMGKGTRWAQLGPVGMRVAVAVVQPTSWRRAPARPAPIVFSTAESPIAPLGSLFGAPSLSKSGLNLALTHCNVLCPSKGSSTSLSHYWDNKTSSDEIKSVKELKCL